MPFVGTDLVQISAFAEQLERPGSTFENVFSARELRTARTKPSRAEHLAGRWAVKEAFIKAWSQSMYGSPPPIARDAVDFAEIETVPDRWNRIAVVVRGEVARAVGTHRVQASISHDGDYALAVVNFWPGP